MNSAPKVSVIIPTYNAASYVVQAVSSALASRAVSLEVLVIDDESSDDTWQVLEGFGNSIHKARQAKGGPYKARNLGAVLPEANGWHFSTLTMIGFLTNCQSSWLLRNLRPH